MREMREAGDDDDNVMKEITDRGKYSRNGRMNRGMGLMGVIGKYRWIDGIYEVKK